MTNVTLPAAPLFVFMGVTPERSGMAEELLDAMGLAPIGDIVGVPVGDLFMGAVFPGLVLVGRYSLYILLAAFIKPEWAPAVRAKGESHRWMMVAARPPNLPALRTGCVRFAKL